jgi:hypothetical protein
VFALWVALVVIGVLMGIIVVFSIILALLLMQRHCPARRLAEAHQVDLLGLLPVLREATVRDPAAIARLVGFMTDELQRSVDMPPLLRLVFHVGERRTYELEASAGGWNWTHELPSRRKLTDALAFLEYANSLLPPVTEADLDAIPIPEEDLSWFDESKVPEDLRDLIDLAMKWGGSDDLLRGEQVRRATPQERRELIDRVLPRGGRIQEYIESHGVPSLDSPLSDECVRFMYLWEAAQEAEAYA